MPTQPESFTRALGAGRPLSGLWVSLADSLAAEICSGAGFDWLLIDAEHAPNDLRTVLWQLQAIDGSGSHAIVRPACGDAALLKQYLDLGATSLMVPMVDTAAEAERLVAAVRYPPLGTRGVASARASRWGRRSDYFARANDEVCLIVQIESVEAVANIESIAAVDGVNALFIGPSDLAAALGYIGQPAHESVQRAVTEAIGRVRAAGKPAGVLAVNEAAADAYVSAGASFVGLGVDTLLLARATTNLATSFAERTNLP